jgi:hypothetical protein
MRASGVTLPSWIGIFLLALAVCPIASAEGERASRPALVARPIINRGVESQTAGTTPPTPPSVAVAPDPGGAVYLPFSQAPQPEGRVTAAPIVRPTRTDDASPTAAILAALGGLAAFGYLLRRLLNGF